MDGKQYAEIVSAAFNALLSQRDALREALEAVFPLAAAHVLATNYGGPKGQLHRQCLALAEAALSKDAT